MKCPTKGHAHISWNWSMILQAEPAIYSLMDAAKRQGIADIGSNRSRTS